MMPNFQRLTGEMPILFFHDPCLMSPTTLFQLSATLQFWERQTCIQAETTAKYVSVPEQVLVFFQILLCFGIAVTTQVYVGYAVVALLVEVNSIFLHTRQLLQVLQVPKDSSIFRTNSLLCLGEHFFFLFLCFSFSEFWSAQKHDWFEFGLLSWEMPVTGPREGVGCVTGGGTSGSRGNAFLGVWQKVNWWPTTFARTEYRKYFFCSLSGTYIAFRIATLAWMTRWIVVNRDLIPLLFYSIGSIGTNRVLNLNFRNHRLSVNVTLSWACWNSDKRTTFVTPSLNSFCCFIAGLAIVTVMNIVLFGRLLRSDFLRKSSRKSECFRQHKEYWYTYLNVWCQAKSGALQQGMLSHLMVQESWLGSSFWLPEGSYVSALIKSNNALNCLNTESVSLKRRSKWIEFCSVFQESFESWRNCEKHFARYFYSQFFFANFTHRIPASMSCEIFLPCTACLIGWTVLQQLFCNQWLLFTCKSYLGEQKQLLTYPFWKQDNGCSFVLFAKVGCVSQLM